MTYVAHVCPCCSGKEHDAYPALVSPFVATYALEEKPGPTRLLECRTCQFRFFEDRLTPSEADRLYDGYRGERYYRARHAWEPWYTRKVNDGIGGDDDVVRARRSALSTFVRSHVDPKTIEDVLDFGGDRGQFIPDDLGKRRFVYEISGVDTAPNVTRIASASDLTGRTFDLVILSHVLEHCSEPKDMLEQVKPLLGSRDAVLYVELPLERPNLRWLGKRGLYRTYLDVVRKAKPMLMAVDLYSTLLRVKRGTIPPLGFVKLHEHLNFFDARSLTALFERAGLEPIAIEEREIHSSVGDALVLSSLARLR